ncbi:MAG: hypothetical protein ACI89X_004705 [Planctomycetota bacterium]|jgi:hypothetical protein
MHQRHLVTLTDLLAANQGALDHIMSDGQSV